MDSLANRSSRSFRCLLRGREGDKGQTEKRNSQRDNRRGIPPVSPQHQGNCCRQECGGSCTVSPDRADPNEDDGGGPRHQSCRNEPQVPRALGPVIVTVLFDGGQPADSARHHCGDGSNGPGRTVLPARALPEPLAFNPS